MTVEICEVRSVLFANVGCAYMVPKDVSNDRGFFSFRRLVDISDRFKPQMTPAGRMIVNCDGTGYMLGEVLGMDGQENPAIVWKDDQHGYLHRVKLEAIR